MRTLLLHLARGYSLHETVVRAKAAGVAELSAVALFKRLQQAEDWFKELCQVLLPRSGVAVPADPKAVRLRLVDSTTVKEPGKTGSWWRIQYSFQSGSGEASRLSSSHTTGHTGSYHGGSAELNVRGSTQSDQAQLLKELVVQRHAYPRSMAHPPWPFRTKSRRVRQLGVDPTLG